MKRIKFLKGNNIELDGVLYRGYSVCELPNQFGMTEDILDDKGEIISRSSLIGEWFNYKGLTYIIK